MVTDRPGTRWQTSSIVCTRHWFQLTGFCLIWQQSGSTSHWCKCWEAIAGKGGGSIRHTVWSSLPVRVRDMIHALLLHDIIPAEMSAFYSLFHNNVAGKLTLLDFGPWLSPLFYWVIHFPRCHWCYLDGSNIFWTQFFFPSPFPI